MKYFTLLLLAATSYSFASSALTDQDIETYYSQGYFIKKRYLSCHEIQEVDRLSFSLIEKSLDFIQDESIPFKEATQIKYLNGAQIVFKKSEDSLPSIFRIPSCADLEPKLSEILSSKTLIETFFHILNCDDLEQIICQFHPKRPLDGITFPKHVDSDNRKFFDPAWTDIAGNGSCAIAIIAVDPMSKENGGLFIDIGSYPEKGEEQPLEVILEPGDLLFLHPEIIHWSSENTSDRSRRTLLSGFCVFGANHKNYPGNGTNNCYKKKGTEIEIREAPWKLLNQESF